MAIVVPAILEKTREGFLEKESLLKKLSGLERVQVDFADGVFVPNTLLSVDEIDTLSPMFEWEAHLMIKNPADFLDYQICGFGTILIHFEAFPDSVAVKNTLNAIKDLGMKAGVVVNPGTPIDVLDKFGSIADQFLIMAVEPGFQGAAFIESTYDRIFELRKLFPHAIIEVDGGVKEENIRHLKDAGADYLATGSTLFRSNNISETFQKLSDEAK